MSAVQLEPVVVVQSRAEAATPFPAATAFPAEVQTAAAFGQTVGSWFLLWAPISALFTIGARLVTTTALIALALLAVVLLCAGLATIVGGDTAVTLTRIAGWAGLMDGAAAFWLAGGLLLTTVCGRDALPLGSADA